MGLDLYAGTLTRYYSHNWKMCIRDRSDTMRKCRIGTAKFFTLLLLLYRTSANWWGYSSARSTEMPTISSILAASFLAWARSMP